MSYEILWSHRAELTIAQNMDYIAHEWNEKVLKSFFLDTEKVIQKIKLNPFIYPLCDSEINVRKAIINKRIVLYYQIIDNKTIELLTFWNTYRNPKDLKL